MVISWLSLNDHNFISKRDRGMGLLPSEWPNLVYLMTPIKMVGHENKFSIFLTKTVKVAHFKKRFLDHLDHYTSNQQPIKTNDHITTFYLKLSLFWFKLQYSTYNGCSEKWSWIRWKILIPAYSGPFNSEVNHTYLHSLDMNCIVTGWRMSILR